MENDSGIKPVGMESISLSPHSDRMGNWIKRSRPIWSGDTILSFRQIHSTRPGDFETRRRHGLRSGMARLGDAVGRGNRHAWRAGTGLKEAGAELRQMEERPYNAFSGSGGGDRGGRFMQGMRRQAGGGATFRGCILCESMRLLQHRSASV